jgi:hypothetical protein
MFLLKYKEKQSFCGHKILIEVVFESRKSNNAEMRKLQIAVSISRIVWVKKNFCLNLTNCVGYDKLLSQFDDLCGLRQITISI